MRRHRRSARNYAGAEAVNLLSRLASRQRNNDLRGTNQNSGDILFDQILIPPRMRDFYVAGSAKVYDDPVAVRGNGTTRASDHLPVSAEFVFESQADSGSGLRIAALLPDPVGKDRGK